MLRGRIDAGVSMLVDDQRIGEPADAEFSRWLRGRGNREREVERPVTEWRIGGQLLASPGTPVAWTAGELCRRPCLTPPPLWTPDRGSGA